MSALPSCSTASFLGASLIWLMMAAPALAQDVATGAQVTDIVLDAVVVQGERGDGPVGSYVAGRSRAGTKIDTPIERTAQSISVVPREQMQDQGAGSVAEALRYTPGAFTEYRGDSNVRDEIFVRGFYYVPRYLDGLALGDSSQSKILPYLLERVELLSGPASVLYGQANPGGIVNMVSKKPTDEPYRQVEFSFGTHSQLSASVDVSDRMPGVEGLSYRLVATGLRRDLQEDFTRQEGYAFAPSLRWEPDADTSLTVLAGYQNEPHVGYRNFLDRAGTVEPIAGYGYVPRGFFVSDPDYERFEREQVWVGYEFEHRLNEAITLRQNARYFRTAKDHYSLIWGSPSLSPITGANTSISRIASGGPDREHHVTIDNQMQAEFTTGALAHTLLGGLDYRYDKTDSLWYRSRDVPAIDLAEPVYGNIDFSSLNFTAVTDRVRKVRQAGLYFQDQIEVDNWTLLLGGRHDWASTDTTNRLSGIEENFDDNDFTWRAGAVYTFDNGLSPYASYSTSFEPVLQSPNAGEPDFDPTTAEQFEVGLKYAPAGMNMLLTAAFYELTQKGVVQGVWSSDLGQTVYSQIGEIRSRGVELSARAELAQGFSLVGGYAYLDSQITESANASEVGRTPARTPAHTASLWGTYAVQHGALEGLKVGGGLRHIGTSYGNAANEFKVDAVTLADAMVSYDFGYLDARFEGVELQVNAKNLADTRYVASCASNTSCFYGSGRSVVATLRKTW
ncbi:TonB-dependent siderophore receptor [Aureimonas populi]|uniref:TonB-dependent siderophore receptor n=1 Tax=Aureimonas populi TaxID=1701758 RepID=A0ABW5CNX0_9HYPH|nr:TonB-dependent siderophore receptor [Aureimonas populi]